MSWQLEDMTEGGRLARAAVALVSACGLVDEGHKLPVLFGGHRKGRRAGRDRTWVTFVCDEKKDVLVL